MLAGLWAHCLHLMAIHRLFLRKTLAPNLSSRQSRAKRRVLKGQSFSLRKTFRKMMEEEEVTVTMRLARRKFDRILQDGDAHVFTWEVSHGFSWTKTIEDKSPFEEGLNNFIRELRSHDRCLHAPDIPIATLVVHLYVDPILWGRELRWVEGPLGWTTWI
ncbi:uncharacterized protein LOC131856250 [Cryptomeria japonica]|uniref:uncharacterized protein LOC131856250 n=1 Tax=Cryptomeria japonica TaxID=3369 RepID=UPI0027DA7DDE|nr:uncharacterized protein LOC131856250 [Cryptomeria japonica]